jgi:hypothetical protein
MSLNLGYSILNISIKKSPSSPKLIVKAPGFADNGVYVCIAENEFEMSLNLGYSILNISIKNYLEPDAKAI